MPTLRSYSWPLSGPIKYTHEEMITILQFVLPKYTKGNIEKIKQLGNELLA